MFDLDGRPRIRHSIQLDVEPESEECLQCVKSQLQLVKVSFVSQAGHRWEIFLWLKNCYRFFKSLSKVEEWHARQTPLCSSSSKDLIGQKCRSRDVDMYSNRYFSSVFFVCLFVIYLFVWASWRFSSYSADVDLLYPPIHIQTEDSHNTGNFIPYSSRIVCGFFNVPQGTNEHWSYLWDGTSGLSSLSEKTWKSNHLRM